MSRSTFNWFTFCFLIVYCSAENDHLWDKSDYRTSDETPAGKSKLQMNADKSFKDSGMKLNDIWQQEDMQGMNLFHATKKLKNTLPSIKLTPEQITKFKIWPNATIPFYIDTYSYDKVLRDQIRDHLDHATFLTGLNFEEIPDPPKDDKERWVLFVNRRGQLDCKDYSTNSFTNEGVQKVIVGYDCLRTRGPMAAIVMALAGVPPQHNAPNRDSFIKVSMDSIMPEKRDVFKALNDDEWLFRDLPYDYGSVGHYPSYKYTVDGSATIRGIEKGSLRKLNVNWMDNIKENDDYTSVDLGKIIMLYKNIISNNSKAKGGKGKCQRGNKSINNTLLSEKDKLRQIISRGEVLSELD